MACLFLSLTVVLPPTLDIVHYIWVWQLYYRDLKSTTLDELDMKVLNSLSRNCRVSYSSLGNEIGLTAKSVKARVEKMQSSDVIDSFITKVSPLVLGYTKVCVLIVRISNKKEAHQKYIERSLSLLGDIFDRIDGLGNISIFVLAIKKEAEEKLELLADVVGQDVLMQNQTITFPCVREQPTYTDFKIMRCLLASPRMEISDIAEEISMSSKTVSRRLGKMIENRVLDFTVHLQPYGYTGIHRISRLGLYRKRILLKGS